MNRMLLAFALFLAAPLLRAQDSTAVRDSVGALPRLEIPEITIVGKKAIILPFARKGEVYDATLYTAPPPDSSLLGSRRMMPLPIGALPRYEEYLDPWRASLSGGLGNYTSGNLYGYLDYTALTWGIGGTAGFATTQGHTWNSDGNLTDFALSGHSLVQTDNSVLNSFRADGNLSYRRQSYGMYGIPGYAIRRTTKNVGLGAAIGSTNREGGVIDVSLGANILNLTDGEQTGDSSISVVTPSLGATFSADANATRIVIDFLYRNSSLNYHTTAQSPGLIALSGGARWQFAEAITLTLRGIFQHATSSDGNDHTLVAPAAEVTWASGKDRVWSFWYRPEYKLAGYDELLQQNPYLIRELVLRPERSPFRIGSTLQYNSDHLSLALEGSYAHTSDKAITLADSGRIRLGYADADGVTLSGKGTLTIAEPLALQFHGTIEPMRAKGTSVQLPMLPIVAIGAKLECGAGSPITFWGESNYTSRRNVDLAGSRTLPDAVLFGGGVSTHIIPRTSLSFHIDNIFNTAFQRWEGYSAAGRQFMVEANISLR